jgi:hypothetical protein
MLRCRRARLRRHSGVRAGGQLARVRNERPPTSTSERSRARTAPLGGRMAARIACDEGLIAVPDRAGYGSCGGGGRGVRTLSRGAVVDNGDTSRRPNLWLLVAFRLHMELTTDRFDSARSGCRRLAPPSAPLTAGAFMRTPQHATPHAPKAPTHLHQRMLSRYFVVV